MCRRSSTPRFENVHIDAIHRRSKPRLVTLSEMALRMNVENLGREQTLELRLMLSI